MAEKDLRIIQSSRHVKKMTDFYREVENAQEFLVIATAFQPETRCCLAT